MVPPTHTMTTELRLLISYSLWNKSVILNSLADKIKLSPSLSKFKTKLNTYSMIYGVRGVRGLGQEREN